ncbi:MAG: ribonuclease H-like domain-containing protein [Pseudomonadota bacterium]
MTNHLHHGDLPAGLDFGDSVAVDSETLGLNPHRDRLCLVQLSAGDGDAHLVQIAKEQRDAPNLVKLLGDQAVTKIFHYARFDLAALFHHLGIMATPVYCTKIASRLTRTYTDRHGLKDLCGELLGVQLSKEQQSSDWAADALTDDQIRYAAADVLHLHALRDALDTRLAREERTEFAEACFTFLPTRARLDLAGWPDADIFAHS